MSAVPWGAITAAAVGVCLCEPGEDSRALLDDRENTRKGLSLWTGRSDGMVTGVCSSAEAGESFFSDVLSDLVVAVGVVIKLGAVISLLRRCGRRRGKWSMVGTL